MIKGLALSKVVSQDDRFATVSETDALDWHNLGVKRLRIELGLGQARFWEPGLLALYRAIVDFIISHGIDVHALVPYQAVAIQEPGAWQAPISDASWSAYCAAYASACAALAQALPHVALFELINEPNNLGQPSYLTPYQYAQLFAAAQPAIRQHSPAPISIGGLFSHAMAKYGGVKWENSGAEYLRQVLWILGADLPTTPEPDCVAWHPYVSGGGLLDPTILQTYAGFWAKVTNTPIHISETGWQSAVIGEDKQAANVTTLYKTVAALPQIAACLLFSQYDAPSATPPLTYGLRAQGGLTHKAAWDAFKVA